MPITPMMIPGTNQRPAHSIVQHMPIPSNRQPITPMMMEMIVPL